MSRLSGCPSPRVPLRPGIGLGSSRTTWLTWLVGVRSELLRAVCGLGRDWCWCDLEVKDCPWCDLELADDDLEIEVKGCVWVCVVYVDDLGGGIPPKALCCNLLAWLLTCDVVTVVVAKTLLLVTTLYPWLSRVAKECGCLRWFRSGSVAKTCGGGCPAYISDLTFTVGVSGGGGPKAKPFSSAKKKTRIFFHYKFIFSRNMLNASLTLSI